MKKLNWKYIKCQYKEFNHYICTAYVIKLGYEGYVLYSRKDGTIIHEFKKLKMAKKVAQLIHSN